MFDISLRSIQTTAGFVGASLLQYPVLPCGAFSDCKRGVRMANKRIEDKQNHDAKVGVRLTQEEYARLKKEAKIHGLTFSKIARARLAGTKIQSKADALAIAELRRQGGLLKHIMMEYGDALADRQRVNNLLDEISQTIKRIAQ